ncbi:MAG TPA: hypothetical protein VGM88_27040 [Kofleriaceae bacterium]|jgi:hypothetical protein
MAAIAQLYPPVEYDTIVGQTVPDTIGIGNSGDAPLVVTELDVSLAPAADGEYVFDGLMDPACPGGTTCTGPFTIAPGEYRFFHTLFTPSVTGEMTNTITAVTNAGTIVATETLYGDYPVMLAASPTSFALDPMFADPEFPDSQHVTLLVSAMQPAPYFSFYVDGPYGDTITKSPDCTAASPCVIQPGDGPFAIDIAVSVPGPSYETSLPITIRGVDPTVAPVSVPFHVFVGYPQLSWPDYPNGLPGVIDVGSGPWGVPIAATLVAHVDEPLPIYMDTEFDGATAYVSGPTGPTSFAAGSTLTWSYTCTPEETQDTGTFTVNSDQGLEVQSVIIECAGTGPLPDGGVDAMPDAALDAAPDAAIDAASDAAAPDAAPDAATPDAASPDAAFDAAPDAAAPDAAATPDAGGHHHGGGGCAAGGGSGTGILLGLAIGLVALRRINRPSSASRPSRAAS